MKVDLSQLRASVKRLAAGRPDRRKTSDLMGTIRELMPAISQFRADDVPWAVIAASLAEQGVVEGNGRALTEKRLTSVVSKLKRQAERRAVAKEARASRGDLAEASDRRTSPFPDPGRPSAKLAPELTRPCGSSDERPPISEAEILREQRQKQQHLFRKD